MATSKKATGQQKALESARHHLIEALTGYSAFHGCPTRIVFDAHYQPGMKTRRSKSPMNSQIYFTESGQTADTYIELFCAQARYQNL